MPQLPVSGDQRGSSPPTGSARPSFRALLNAQTLREPATCRVGLLDALSRGALRRPLMLVDLSELLGFVPTLAIDVALVALVTYLQSPSPRQRWAISALALVSPALCPSRGLLSTFFTGMAIVISCRLADLPRFPQRRQRLALALWLSCPVVRALPATADQRAQNRRRAPKTLLRAAAKRALWEGLAALQLTLPPTADLPLVRSAFLILYFVLNLTALADLVLFSMQLLGATTDELFDAPLLARSPRDFWSRRWNRFISRFALKHVALPLTGKASPGMIVLSVFLASGLFHEYFAWGASGASTVPCSMMLFFALQGIVVLVGQRLSALTHAPAAITHALTFVWMALTAPLFFRSLVPPLLAFGFPEARLPWAGSGLDWMPFF